MRPFLACTALLVAANVAILALFSLPPRPAPIPAVPMTWSTLEHRAVPITEWRAEVGPQHSQPITSVEL